MDYINDDNLTKYQVTIHFEMDEEFMSLVPEHRVFISTLINKGSIDYYAVSMETQRCWIIMNGESKTHIGNLLKQSPLHQYWTIEIDELFVYDGQTYRMPALQMN